jgi:predicted nucleic acid-binding protein
LILDAGFLISVDRGERAAQEFLTAALIHETPLTTTHPVVAQVWRDGARQTRLARFLRSVVVVAFDDGPEVGTLLARSGSSDVVDAHLVAVAVRRSEAILTGDVHDLESLTAALPEHRPHLFSWPPQ